MSTGRTIDGEGERESNIDRQWVERKNCVVRRVAERRSSMSRRSISSSSRRDRKTELEKPRRSSQANDVCSRTCSSWFFRRRTSSTRKDPQVTRNHHRHQHHVGMNLLCIYWRQTDGINRDYQLKIESLFYKKKKGLVNCFNRRSLLKIEIEIRQALERLESVGDLGGTFLSDRVTPE